MVMGESIRVQGPRGRRRSLGWASEGGWVRGRGKPEKRRASEGSAPPDGIAVISPHLSLQQLLQTLSRGSPRHTETPQFAHSGQHALKTPQTCPSLKQGGKDQINNPLLVPRQEYCCDLYVQAIGDKTKNFSPKPKSTQKKKPRKV